MTTETWGVVYTSGGREVEKYRGPYSQASMYKDMLNDEQTDNNLPRIFTLKRIIK